MKTDLARQDLLAMSLDEEKKEEVDLSLSWDEVKQTVL